MTPTPHFPSNDPSNDPSDDPSNDPSDDRLRDALQDPHAAAPQRALAAILTETERVLDADVRRRAEPDANGLDARLPALSAELEAAAAGAPAEAQRYARRLRAVRARLALCTRDLPAGALEGLYEDVCAETTQASPWARSRMSDAFLDAPQHLVRWRATALAACAVLALGVGLFAGGRLGFDDENTGQALERMDQRDRMLQRLDASGFLPRARRGGAATETLVHDVVAPDATRRGVGITRRRGERSGLFLWYGSAREPAEAQRRLDAVGVKIFPVGTPVDSVEEN